MAQALVVDVSARTVAFEESMKRAANTANKQMGSIGKSVAGISSNFASLTKTVQVATAAIGAIGAIAGIGFLKNMVTMAADAADRIDDLSMQTGIAHERLSGLAYQAKLTGSNLEGAASSIARLNKNMAESVNETSRQAKAFGAIGISVKDVDGNLKSTDKMISELADKFKSYADGPEKAALAQELFGKSGAAMIPLLNEGSVSLQKMQDDVNKYGVVTKDVAKLTSDFNDEQDRMKMMLQGVMLSITASILPALSGMSDALAWLIDNAEGVKAALVGLLSVISVFSFSPVIAGLTAVTKAVLTFTAALLTNPVFLFAAAIGAAGAALYYFRDATIEIGDTTTSISEIALGAWVSVKNGFGAVADYVSDAGSRMANNFGEVGVVIVDVFNHTLAFVKNFINAVIGLFVGFGKVVYIIADAILDTFKSSFDGVRNLAVSLWDGIKKVFQGDFSFSAFSEAFKKEGTEAINFIAEIGNTFNEAFLNTDYVGGVKDVALGMAESLALAGQEARKLNEELSGDSGGNKPNAPSIFSTEGTAENIEKQLSLAKEGYDRLYALTSAALSRELEILSEQRDLQLISERAFIAKRGELQEQAAQANAERLEKTYSDLAAYLEKLQSAPAIDTKQQEKIIQAISKTQKAYDDWQESIAKVGDVSRKTNNELTKYNDQIKAQIKAITDENEKFVKSLNKRVDDLKFENSLIGLSTSAQQRLRAEREIQLQVAERIAEVEKQINALLQADAGADVTALYRQREEIAQAGLDAVDRIDRELQNKDWAETFSNMSDSITDAIMRGFERGESFVDNLKTTLENTFKTMILKPVVNMVINSVMGSVFSGGSSSGVGGIISTIGSFFGFGGKAGGSGNLINIASGAASNAYSAFGGGGLAGSFINSGFGNMMGLSTPLMGPTQSGAALTGSVPTSAGSMVSNALPIIGWILAGMQLDKYLWGEGWDVDKMSRREQETAIAGMTAIDPLFGLSGIGAVWGDKLFRALGLSDKWASILSGSSIFARVFGRRGGPKTGGFASSDGLDIGRYFTPNNEDDFAQEMLGNIEKQWASVASQFGLDASRAQFGFGFDTDPKGDAGSRIKGGVYIDGLREYLNSGTWGRTSEKFEEGLKTEVMRMMLAASRALSEGDINAILGDFNIAEATLEEIEAVFADAAYWQSAVEPMRLVLERTFGQAFDFKAIDELAEDGETLEETMTRLSTVFNATNMAARITGQSVKDLFGVGLDGLEARETFAAIFGGEEEMLAAITTYMQTFRPEETSQLAFEESGFALTSTFDNLGIAIPNSISAFNDLISGLDLTTQEGQRLFSELMSVAPAFDAFIGAIERLGQSFQDSIDAARQQVETIGLSQEELYRYYQDRGNAAYENFLNASSLEEAERYFNEAMEYYMSAFNTLGEDSQITMRDTFLASLDMIEEAYQDVLGRIRDDALAGGADEPSTIETDERQRVILETASQVITDASTVMVRIADTEMETSRQNQRSAQVMADAASAMIAAANGMLTALGNINVTSNVTINDQAVGV